MPQRPNRGARQVRRVPDVMPMITSLLIANRGEIACRIIRTARAMGIRTVAVYSDADAKALHVRMADEAVHIGAVPGARNPISSARRSSPPRRQTGAEAIHPGYGFLSENADFAQDVIDAGLVWVGPKPRFDPRDGAEGCGQDADGRGRGAGDAGLSRRRPVARSARQGGGGDRLSCADQGGRGGRRQGHAQGRCARWTSTTRSTAASARRRRRSATTSCCSRNGSKARAISKCRCSAMPTATSSICSSATARSSAATRK